MVKKGYKQTEVGVIPEDWKNLKIKDIGYLTSGESPSHFDFSTGHLPYFKVEQLNNSVKYQIDTPYHTSSSKPIDMGSIIFPKRGAAISTNKVRLLAQPSLLDTNIMALTITNEQVNNEYLFYWFIRKGLWQIADTTSVPQINNKHILPLQFPFPSFAEQERIADALSDIDSFLTTLEKQIFKKKAIKQGAMQELLTGKHRLPGFSDGWETFVFGDTFDFIPNNAFTRAQMDDTGKVKNVHYGDILTKFGAYISADSKDIPYIAKEIDLSRFAEKCYLQSGDVIIADTAEDETVGKALEVINVECPVLAGQHTLLCRPKVRFAEKFLGYYLNAACYHDQLLPYIVGTKVSSVSKASIAQTKLVVPKYEEQQAISSILADMDDEITELEQKLAKYRQVKQGMMQQLLTGKIRLV